MSNVAIPSGTKIHHHAGTAGTVEWDDSAPRFDMLVASRSVACALCALNIARGDLVWMRTEVCRTKRPPFAQAMRETRVGRPCCAACVKSVLLPKWDAEQAERIAKLKAAVTASEADIEF